MRRAHVAPRFTWSKIRKMLFLPALLAIPFAILVSGGNDPECDDVSAWTVFTKISLTQSVPGSTEAIEWVGLFDQKTLDVSIDIKTHGSKERMAGTVALVGGQVMITKGLTLRPGYEIDALDAPVLSMRLVMILLKRAFPKGPDTIKGTLDIDRTDKIGIKYATPSASGYIPAPWHLKGKVTRLPNGSLGFNLSLTIPSEQPDKQKGSSTINMQGEFAVLGRTVFLDTDSLDGWNTYGIGPQESKQGGRTVLDYGARPQKAKRYKTIGEVRALITEQNSPGVKDATKDFTGFWKTKCDNPFGLQVKHHGNEGKYSIVFCGPGGCGDPSTSRLTFITGDKAFEVVNENELIQIGQSGDRETYHRCTKDTNPILKYR
jgi:hypothetical protein